MHAFVIYDVNDGTWHVGDGRWSRDPAYAKPYGSLSDEAIDEVDASGVMRDRLFVVPAPYVAPKTVPPFDCSRCGEPITSSFEPGVCYNEQSEPAYTNIHDEAREP